LPIPCSILSGNVLQSLGEHIATLNVDGRIVFQLGFANAPASAGTQADAWRLQMKRTSPLAICQPGIVKSGLSSIARTGGLVGFYALPGSSSSPS
jgi:hypothetical protein